MYTFEYVCSEFMDDVMASTCSYEEEVGFELHDLITEKLEKQVFTVLD
jgi:hypothetical protein